MENDVQSVKAFNLCEKYLHLLNDEQIRDIHLFYAVD